MQPDEGTAADRRRKYDVSRSEALLILDLDETLIHSSLEALGREPDFRCGPYLVYMRPGVTSFLRECAEIFELAVWTTATEDYAACIVERIFPEDCPPSFVFTRARCTIAYSHALRRPVYVKDLKKAKRRGYRLERILVVDDTPEMLARNYGNLVPVERFTGDPCDTVLRELLPFLREISEAEDFRRIDKRRWNYRSAE